MKQLRITSPTDLPRDVLMTALIAPRRRLNFLNFVKHTDSVDEAATQAYLVTQARPGREARLVQQPRHQPYHLPPVVFLKPAVISGQWSINGINLCI